MTTWNPYRRLLTINEAAASIDRPASTIRRWISEGLLEPAATNGRTRYYYESDVLQVEKETRRKRRLSAKRALT